MSPPTGTSAADNSKGKAWRQRFRPRQGFTLKRVMKVFVPYLLSLTLLAGCAAQDREAERQNKLWSQNEHRLKLLENNITALNEQVSLLNNRVYEVRSANGRKTGMSVVPVVPVAKAPEAKTSHAPAPARAQTPAKPKEMKPHPAPQAPRQAARPESKPSPRPEKTPSLPQTPPVVDSGLPMLPPADSTPAPSNPALPPTLPLEGSFSLPPTQAPEQPKAQAPTPSQAAPKPAQAARQPAAAAKAGEEASYQQALKAARSGRSEEGIQKFREFLSNYPNGKYAPNAEFWIGECLYNQGKYQEALGQYSTVNSKYPKHHKNADALLKSGMSYKRLGDSAKAKDSYGRLLKEFPNSEAARRVRGSR